MNLLPLVTLFILCHESPIKQVVLDYHNLKNREQELQFYNKYKNETSPSVWAYLYSIKMKQASYGYNPKKKINIFNTNKQKLNDLISKFPTNVHLRYIRLLLQEQTPLFLGYKSYISSDKLFLRQILQITDESDYLDPYILKNTSL